MITMERGKYYMGGKVYGFELPVREFPCATPKQVRADLPQNKDVVAFQVRRKIRSLCLYLPESE
jgi:sulfate adenylyltransferase